eukprot:m.327670 g.327670  ORF g.327670 m.327670 type:complete len:129 (+) comp16496_c0_seq2:169-555(+)
MATAARTQSTAPGQRVAATKARIAEIRTRAIQVEAEIGRLQTERDQLDSSLAEAEAELEEAVNAPVEGGEDPTSWLPDELLLMIFALLELPWLCGRRRCSLEVPTRLFGRGPWKMEGASGLSRATPVM